MIIIDIETTANAGMIQFLPEPTPPGNYKKAESIARWMEDARKKQADKAALDLDAARIISIAVAKDDGEPVGWTVPVDDRQDRMAEMGLLCEFWDWLEQTRSATRRFVGYNIRKFDLPILLRRTWQHNLAQATRIAPMLASRHSDRVVDLMELLYHNGYTSTHYRGLKAVCQMYGIDNPMPDIDGSMVDGLSADELLAYNMNDVALTQELARRTEGYYWFHK